jgi:hypothetical protein
MMEPSNLTYGASQNTGYWILQPIIGEHDGLGQRKSLAIEAEQRRDCKGALRVVLGKRSRTVAPLFGGSGAKICLEGGIRIAIAGMRVLGFRKSLPRALSLYGVFVFFGGLGVVHGQDIRPITLSAPCVLSNAISFSFASATNQVLTLERSSTLAGDWERVAQFPGTGDALAFSASVEGSRRFFRVQVAQLPAQPRIIVQPLTLKAGSPVKLQMQVDGGFPPFSWSVDGVLPDGLALSADGVLSGTPTADSAEHNGDGRYLLRLHVADSFRDPQTDQVVRRRATNDLAVLIRLSYSQNIYATRPDGPSLHHNCSICHSSDFKPDFDAGALGLMNVFSGSGAECGTDRAYVSPPDASDSLIYEKVTERFPCGERMPFDGPYLSDKEIARLARWIRELTPDDED